MTEHLAPHRSPTAPSSLPGTEPSRPSAARHARRHRHRLLRRGGRRPAHRDGRHRPARHPLRRHRRPGRLPDRRRRAVPLRGRLHRHEPYIRNAGAFYSYIARGLGRPAGLGAALLARVLLQRPADRHLRRLRLLRRRHRERPPRRRPALAGLRLRRHRPRLVPRLPLASTSAPRSSAACSIAETAILVLLAVAILVKGGARRSEPGLLRPRQRLHLGS